MRISKTTACWNLLLLLAIPCSVGAQAKSAQDTHKSAGEFVQQFYDWYVPRALKHNAGPASDLALKYKDRVFSPKLFRALKEGLCAGIRKTTDFCWVSINERYP